jgi:type I restriction enzyme S subunit
VSSAPKGWKAYELADLVSDVKSGFASGEKTGDGVLQLRMNNVSGDGSLAFDDQRRVPCSESTLRSFRLEEGDILFNNTNSPELVGKTAMFAGFSEPVVFSNHFTRLRLHRDAVEPNYLVRWMIRQWKHRLFQGLCTQWVNQASVRKETLLGVTVPIPPLREQKRIASILEKADAIQRMNRAAITLTDDLLRSVFLEDFGDPATNPKNWNLKPIEKLATITTGSTPPRSSVELYEGDLEWIKSDNINTPSHVLTRADETLSELGRKKARIVGPGATLITCIAGSADCIGNAAMADREVAFNQQINALEPLGGVDPHFLYAQVLVGKRLIQAASTKSMKGMVSKGRLGTVEFVSPPESEQSKFGDWFCKWAKLSDDMTCSSRAQEELMNSLSQRAFQGEL